MTYLAYSRLEVDRLVIMETPRMGVQLSQISNVSTFMTLFPQRRPRQLRPGPAMLVHVPSEFVLESGEAVLVGLETPRRVHWLPSLQVWLFETNQINPRLWDMSRHTRSHVDGT